MFCNFSASFEQKNEVARLSPLVTFNITTFEIECANEKTVDLNIFEAYAILVSV